MKALLLQLDGKLPNVALMRVAAHHRARGDEVSFAHAGNEGAVVKALETSADVTYASLIFERTRGLGQFLASKRPGAILGGTGWDVASRLEDHEITTKDQDYSLYPDFKASIGFTQRGCRLRCSFCVVPKKEGAISEEQTIAQLWRGEGHPKHLHLLDNDFFGQPRWRERIAEIRDGGFKVSFTQGINARTLDDEAAEAIASVNYRDDSFKERRIYTAWDNRKDEARLFAGLESLVRYGVKPRNIMVYMLIGYWPGETAEDRLYRQKRLRDFGARPYPMPYRHDAELAALRMSKEMGALQQRAARERETYGHTLAHTAEEIAEVEAFVQSGAQQAKIRAIEQYVRELVGFQRWCIGAYDKRIPWDRWVRAKYQPRNLGRNPEVACDH